MAMASNESIEQSDGADDRRTDQDAGAHRLDELVEEPAKVVRIGRMVFALLQETRELSLDDAGRARLSRSQRDAVDALRDGLAPGLRSELDRLWQPFADDEEPSDSELRIAQAELVGWLEGVFQGLQVAMGSEQTAAAGRQGELPGQTSPEADRHTGHYL